MPKQAKPWLTAEGLAVQMVDRATDDLGMVWVRPVGAPDDGTEDQQVPKDSLTRPGEEPDAG